MGQYPTNGKFSVEIYATPDLPPITCRIEPLVNDALGRKVIDTINQAYRGIRGRWAEYMQVNLLSYAEDKPIQRGRIFYLGVVKRALEFLGEHGYRIAGPDNVIGIIRSDYITERHFPSISQNLWNEFGILIRRVGKEDPEFIKDLVERARELGYTVPFALFNLHTLPDSKSEMYGAKLVFADDTICMSAPALVGSTFKSKAIQGFANLLVTGRDAESKLEGKLEVTTSDCGIVAIARRGFQIATVNDLFRRFNPADESGGVVLLARDSN